MIYRPDIYFHDPCMQDWHFQAWFSKEHALTCIRVIPCQINNAPSQNWVIYVSRQFQICLQCVPAVIFWAAILTMAKNGGYRPCQGIQPCCNYCAKTIHSCISTTVHSQVLSFTHAWTEASWIERKLQQTGFDMWLPLLRISTVENLSFSS